MQIIVQNYALNLYAVYRVHIIKRKIKNKCGMEIELNKHDELGLYDGA